MEYVVTAQTNIFSTFPIKVDGKTCSTLQAADLTVLLESHIFLLQNNLLLTQLRLRKRKLNILEVHAWLRYMHK